MSEDEPWRDPSRLTEADKARLGRLTDRQAQALDVTSDEHEYVWGFRQDREHERCRWMASEAAFTREQVHEQLRGRGHAMTWQPASGDSPQVLTWNGECADCGANASAGAMSSSRRNLSRQMRHQAAWVVCGERSSSGVAGGSLIQAWAGIWRGRGRRWNRSGWVL
jgi:hypothetical protein